MPPFASTGHKFESSVILEGNKTVTMLLYTRQAFESTIRSTGITRAWMNIGITNLVYNFCRYSYLKRTSARYGITAPFFK